MLKVNPCFKYICQLLQQKIYKRLFISEKGTRLSIPLSNNQTQTPKINGVYTYLFLINPYLNY